MTENIKVREVVKYGGHSIGANGSVNLTLKASYSELSNTVKLLQLLNNDVSIKAKLPGSKAMKLGMMRIRDIKIDNDGESVVKFNGLTDYIEVDNLNSLVTSEEFAVAYEAEVELESDDEDESEE